MELNNKIAKGRSHNERFHASGCVRPQKVLCGFESLSPARTFVGRECNKLQKIYKMRSKNIQNTK